MKQHIDYDKATQARYWWLNKTGGTAQDNLTVLDVFAAEAMRSLLTTKVCKRQSDVEAICADAYTIANAMMEERTKQESNDA